MITIDSPVTAAPRAASLFGGYRSISQPHTGFDRRAGTEARATISDAVARS